MIVVLSGEGPTDFGVSASMQDIAYGTDFLFGPLTQLLQQLILQLLGPDFEYLREPEFECFRLVSNRYIAARKDEFRPYRFPGKKRKPDTIDISRRAQALAVIACELREQLGQNDVIAVLFKDADDNAATPLSSCDDKWTAAKEGFKMANFEFGVPMIPQPISEAWLLCAFKDDPYQHCEQLEEESRSKRSPNGLKQQLREVLGEETTRESLLHHIETRGVDATRIDMPSFNDFKKRLDDVLRSIFGLPNPAKRMATADPSERESNSEPKAAGG